MFITSNINDDNYLQRKPVEEITAVSTASPPWSLAKLSSSPDRHEQLGSKTNSGINWSSTLMVDHVGLMILMVNDY